MPILLPLNSCMQSQRKDAIIGTMKRAAFWVFLACLIGSVMSSGTALCADWQLVGQSDSGQYYVDRETAGRSSGTIREARELTVLGNDPETNRFIEVVEYDCAARKKRVFQRVVQRKSGEANLTSSKQPPWTDVPLDRQSKAFFDAACGK